MGLVACKECGHKISNKASSCPSCGTPLKKGGCGSGCAVVLLILLIMLIVAADPFGLEQAERQRAEDARREAQAEIQQNWESKKTALIEEAQSLLAKGDFESVFEKMKPYSIIRDEELSNIVNTAKDLREQAAAKQDEEDRKARIAEIESTLRDAPVNNDALVRELLMIDPGNESYASALAELKATDSGKRYERVKDNVKTGYWGTAQNHFERISADGYGLEALTTEVETLALEVIRPIPADDFEANLDGYKFLSILRPDKTEYKNKITHFEDLLAQALGMAVAKLNRSEDRVSKSESNAISLDEIEQGIRDQAAKEWPGDFQMQQHTIKQQTKAYNACVEFNNAPGVPERIASGIMSKARREWGRDWVMVDHTIKQQIKAYKALSR